LLFEECSNFTGHSELFADGDLPLEPIRVLGRGSRLEQL